MPQVAQATLSPPPPPDRLNAASPPVPPGSVPDYTSPSFTPASNGSSRLPDGGSPHAGRSPVASEEDHGVSRSYQAGGGSLGERRQRDLSLNQMPPRSGSPASVRNNGEVPNFSLPRSPSDRNAAARQRADQMDGRSSPSLQNPPPRDASLKQSTSSSSRGFGIGLGVGPVGGASGSSSPTPAAGSGGSMAPPPVPGASSSLSPSLGVPTSRAERRRSINPGLSFNMDPQNSTFSAEPRQSPRAASPLRPSFHDVQSELMGKSPTSPTFVAPGVEGFPFRRGSPSSAAGAIMGSSSAQSLSPDTQSFQNSFLSGPAARTGSPGGQARRSPPVHGRISSPSAPANLSLRGTEPPVSPSSRDLAALSQRNGSTPRLVAPSLPAMSFSLSDPDFANILNSMDEPGAKAGATGSSNKGSPVRMHESAEPAISLDESPPVSPALEGITRSPGSVDMLASASAGSNERKGSLDPINGLMASGSRSRSHSASGARLASAGNALPAPQFLRSRQQSAESVLSSTSRGDPNSAFGLLADIVAGAGASGTSAEGGERAVEVDVGILSRVLVEIGEMRQDMSDLRTKYSGAKVSFPGRYMGSCR